MSSPHDPRNALQMLDQRLEKSSLPDYVKIYFVTSYPRSDMGKGTLVAHMLRMLPNSDALKFDGLLNTNVNGRHTARGHDDFGLYEKYNPSKQFGDEHYILGGYLFKDFIDKYGEYENLTIRPYMVKHFIATIEEMWHEIGEPTSFIIEIGGTITDYEVEPYIAPAIRDMVLKYGGQVTVVLLSELGFNNEYIKTKTVQDAVTTFIERTITPNIIIAREPSDIGSHSVGDGAEFERLIRTKLKESTGIDFQKILSVPFYKQENINLYGEYLDKHLRPIITSQKKHSEILIGTGNPNKVADWQSFLGDEFKITAASSIGLKLDVVEGMTSIKENSLAKAKAWCRISGLPTIADDTGLYINSLNGAPGVAVRRWGGKLPESSTDEDFFSCLQHEVLPLEDTSCYLEAVVTLALPNGDDFQIVHRTSGHINKDRLKEDFQPGNFPLSLVFQKDGRDKVWAEMTDIEKRESDQELVSGVLELLHRKLNQ